MVQFCYLRLYSGIETFPRRLLPTNGNDGNGMKLENVGTTLSSFTALPAKISGKLLWPVLPEWWWNFVSYRLHNFIGAFCVWVKAITAISSWHSSLNTSIIPLNQDLPLPPPPPFINCWWRLVCAIFVKTEVHCQLWERGWPTSLLEEQV